MRLQNNNKDNKAIFSSYIYKYYKINHATTTFGQVSDYDFFSIVRQFKLIKIFFRYETCHQLLADMLHNWINLLSKKESFCRICILYNRQFVECWTSWYFSLGYFSQGRNSLLKS